ncbi:hypothetical protein KDH_61790 [Dictyobacter sp. S3.2.2.5]|uniref:Uncharacterized protein n=1 Tax=Dictyobacter halimunensis TaxID=3026934 RepID=A0ABQ6G1G3_9CHLR|nr:hypothetical protein KDH_61790 [Dictyobacter sp. S3.2.2.5]
MTTVRAGLAPACILATRKSNEHDAMHRMQPYLIAFKEPFLLGTSKAGASPARTVAFSRFVQS